MAHTIAIIEDDTAILNMYQLKFEAEGVKVKTATNGVDGLLVIQATKPDVILLDLMMPQMGGAEMLTKLRKIKGFAKTKVVILTNIGEQELPKELKNLGISEIIMKAYHTPAQVFEKIQDLLK